MKIECIEEIAYIKGYIDRERLIGLVQPLVENRFGRYLINLAEKGV